MYAPTSRGAIASCGALDHQRRHGHLREVGPVVGQERGAGEHPRDGRVGAAEAVGQLLAQLRPVRVAHDHRRHRGRPAEVVAVQRRRAARRCRLGAEPAAVVAVVDVARRRGEQDQLGEPRRLGGDGQHADHRADRVPDEHHVAQVQLAADVQDVLGVAVEGGVPLPGPGRQVRPAGADVVEQHDPVVLRPARARRAATGSGRSRTRARAGSTGTVGIARDHDVVPVAAALTRPSCHSPRLMWPGHMRGGGGVVGRHLAERAARSPPYDRFPAIVSRGGGQCPPARPISARRPTSAVPVDGGELTRRGVGRRSTPRRRCSRSTGSPRPAGRGLEVATRAARPGDRPRPARPGRQRRAARPVRHGRPRRGLRRGARRARRRPGGGRRALDGRLRRRRCSPTAIPSRVARLVLVDGGAPLPAAARRPGDDDRPGRAPAARCGSRRSRRLPRLLARAPVVRAVDAGRRGVRGLRPDRGRATQLRSRVSEEAMRDRLHRPAHRRGRAARRSPRCRTAWRSCGPSAACSTSRCRSTPTSTCWPG